MRKIVIILIAILSFGCTSHIKKEESLGLWICEYGTQINYQKEEVILPIEFRDTDEFIEESGVDTSYFPKLIVFDFSAGGILKYIHDYKSEGKWLIDGDSIRISIDSVSFLGKLEQNELTIETRDSLGKLMLKFRRIEKANAKEIYENEIIGTLWKYTINDSIIASYHILDSNSMIVNDKYGLHFGQWNYGHCSGVSMFSTINMHYANIRLFYILDNHGKTLINSGELSTISPPNYIEGKFKQYPLLSKKQKTKTKKQIIGNWESSDFKIAERNSKDTSKYKDLLLRVEFDSTIFNLQYSGIDKRTNQFTIRNFIGTWDLSETGEYLFLKYSVKDNRRTYETENIVSVVEIKNDTATIGLRNIFLDEYRPKGQSLGFGS